MELTRPPRARTLTSLLLNAHQPRAAAIGRMTFLRAAQHRQRETSNKQPETERPALPLGDEGS